MSEKLISLQEYIRLRPHMQIAIYPGRTLFKYLLGVFVSKLSGHQRDIGAPQFIQDAGGLSMFQTHGDMVCKSLCVNGF